MDNSFKHIPAAVDFSSMPLFNTPSTVCAYVEQSKSCGRLEERLAQDWRRAFSEQLVDSVQDIYDFFQSDTRLFNSSALFRLLKHLELRMSSHLRSLFTVRARGILVCRMMGS